MDERKLREDQLAEQQEFKSDKTLPAAYNSFMRDAHNRGLYHNVTLKQFLDLKSQPCTYCKREMKVGIDRIDSRYGYDLDNCQPCCYACNMMKYVHTEQFFFEHVERIYKNIQGRKPRDMGKSDTYWTKNL